jgi:predicted metallopeptidase
MWIIYKQSKFNAKLQTSRHYAIVTIWSQFQAKIANETVGIISTNLKHIPSTKAQRHINLFLYIQLLITR